MLGWHCLKLVEKWVIETSYRLPPAIYGCPSLSWNCWEKDSLWILPHRSGATPDQFFRPMLGIFCMIYCRILGNQSRGLPFFNLSLSVKITTSFSCDMALVLPSSFRLNPSNRKLIPSFSRRGSLSKEAESLFDFWHHNSRKKVLLNCEQDLRGT